MNLIKMQIPAMFVYVCVLRPISHSVSLATIGVCVFCAVTSVAALFDFGRNSYEKEIIFVHGGDNDIVGYDGWIV